MAVALVTVSALWFLSMVGAGYLLMRDRERADVQLRAMADRVQAPEVSQVAALDALVAQRPPAATPPSPEVLPVLDEDFLIYTYLAKDVL